MTIDEIANAVSAARLLKYQTDRLIRETACLCCGSLRAAEVDDTALVALKRELAGWDSKRRKWK